MKTKALLLVTISLGVMGLLYAKLDKTKGIQFMKLPVQSVQDVVVLFPTSPEQIRSWEQAYRADMQQRIDAVIAVPDEQRTYENTFKAYDDLCTLSPFAVADTTINVIQMVHPDKAMRDTAQDVITQMQNFTIDALSNNVDLYRALKAYATSNALVENLTDEQRYFIKETIENFERGGLGLPEDELAHVKKIKKELAQLRLEFDANIAQDNSFIVVNKEALKGLEDNFIANLEKEGDQYKLGIDYPTYSAVMGNCAVEETRKQLSRKFENRAYPANKVLLERIIALCDELAHALGFASFAHLDIDNQMTGSPERVDEFITQLSAKACVKEAQEFATFTAELPESVTLMQDGKLKPWDISFVQESYKKRMFNVDEQKLAEYFPVEKTVEGLLDIYKQFLSLEFKQVPVSGLWHSDVQMLEVYDQKTKKLLGYLLLDLYPRANKYSHACEIGITQATDNYTTPVTSLVIANFPKASGDRPALFKRADVKTFFHEFGHALHEILGAREVVSLSGTHVKRDFVEMPSQMLEEWLNDKEILKKVSCHYKTGQPIADDVLDTLVALKNFNKGYFLQRQLAFSLLSLNIYKQGAQKDLDTLLRESYETVLPMIAWDIDDHMYCSFGHLTNYNAKYYGYMWSKVFALDLFAAIREHGLLDPEIGHKYRTLILAQGGSKHPDALLQDFLGRPALMDAFIRDMGL